MKPRRTRKEDAGKAEEGEKSGVDDWIAKLKRHPITGALIFICVVLIALENTVDAGAKLTSFFASLLSRPDPPGVDSGSLRQTLIERVVPYDSSQPFSGYWSLQFYFVGDTANRADRSRPWFNWGTELKQTGSQVVGNLKTAEYSGQLEGIVEGNQLSGRVRFSWGDDWWRTFRLTLSWDAQTASGTAVWEAQNGAHVYEVSGRRLQSR